jgi:hypothetical protein
MRWLVIPNCFHHLGTPAAAARYPEAQVVGPASALGKNKELRIDVEIARLGERLPELDVLPLEGVPFLDETVLYHRPTRTLLGADILISACAKDHWTWRTAARITGCFERLRVPPDVRKKLPDKVAVARSLGAMLERPAQLLIVAHSEIIEADCRERLAQAWRLEGIEV